MTRWRRWQDYATMVFGVILAASPFLFGEWRTHTRYALAAYVLGAVLAASGIVAAATPEPRRSLFVNAPGIAAVITLLAAVVFAVGPFDHKAPGITGTAAATAILTLVVGYTLRLGRQARMP